MTGLNDIAEDNVSSMIEENRLTKILWIVNCE